MATNKVGRQLTRWFTSLCAGLLLCGVAHAAAPNPPTGVAATAGNGTVSVSFAPPANNGGSTITSYSATCGTKTAQAPNSPIIVSGLPGGTAVSCTVVAMNIDGNSAPSATSNSVTPLLLLAVQSRKTHNAAGTFDLEIDRSQPLSGAITVEPRVRSIGHALVFQFAGNVTSAGTATVSPAGNAATTLDTNRPNEVLVNLSNLTDGQRATVTLANVNGSITLPAVSVGYLIGDVNSSRAVDATDVSAVKARVGVATNSSNAIFDLNVTGGITAADVSTVKTRAGLTLVSGAPTITSSAPPSGFANEPYSFTFVATGAAPIVWTRTSGTLPPGLTLSTAGVLSGTATAAASFSFTVQADNQNAPVATQSVTIQIAAARPPVITSQPPGPAGIGVFYTHTFTATGAQPIIWSEPGFLPGWLSLTSAGVLSGTPPGAGNVMATVTATNGVTPNATQAINITASAPVPLSITSAAPAAPALNGTYCHSFTASKTVPAGGWSVSAGLLPDWLKLNEKRGVICGIPLSVDVATTNFSIAATVGAETVAQAVTLAVGAIVIPTPVVSQLSQGSGIPGSTVTITGTSFTGATAVTIAGASAGSFSVTSATTISATVSSTAVAATGNVIVTTPGGTSTASAANAFSVIIPQAGVDTSIEGILLPTVSKTPNSIPTHSGLNGATIGAYAMDPTRCTTPPSVNRSWQHNIDLAAYRGSSAVDIFAIRGDETLTYKITTPTIDAAGGFTYLDNISSGGLLAAAFLSVTETPCDFNVTKANPSSPQQNSCYQSSGSGVGLNWLNFVPQSGVLASYCKLNKGQTYYLNIRFIDAIGAPTVNSCPGALCGGSLAFN